MAVTFVVQTGNLTEWELNDSICGLRIEYDTSVCPSVHFGIIRPGIKLYRVIRNDCRGSNNLSYTVHLR